MIFKNLYAIFKNETFFLQVFDLELESANPGIQTKHFIGAKWPLYITLSVRPSVRYIKKGVLYMYCTYRPAVFGII